MHMCGGTNAYEGYDLTYAHVLRYIERMRTKRCTRYLGVQQAEGQQAPPLAARPVAGLFARKSFQLEALSREKTYQDMASYVSSPPCSTNP